MAAAAAAVDDKDCTHSQTVIDTSGTEEIEVCTQCGRAVQSKDSRFENSFSQSTKRCPYSVQDLVSEKLKRFVARDVRSACNEFRFEGQLVTNMTDFLHSFCKQCTAAHFRPYEKHRRAVIVWYVYKESHRSLDHLTVKDICDRLQWPGISPSLVHQVEKKMRRYFPNLVDPFLRVPLEQDPSRELMHLVSSMTKASMPEADKEEVVSFATRLFKCLTEATGTFHHLKHQNNYRVAVAQVTLEHFAAKWQVKGKTDACSLAVLLPTDLTETLLGSFKGSPCGRGQQRGQSTSVALPVHQQCSHLSQAIRKLKEELVKLSKSIPYIAVSCDVANVHRVLDTIVHHVECTEEGSEEAAVEAEFAPLDVAERQEVIKRVQQEVVDSRIAGSVDICEGGAFPEGSVKQEEVIRALLHGGMSADLILRWPTPLSELLDFSRGGEMQEGLEELGEQDLKEEEEGEYILTPQEVLERRMLLQKLPGEEPQAEKQAS